VVHSGTAACGISTGFPSASKAATILATSSSEGDDPNMGLLLCAKHIDIFRHVESSLEVSSALAGSAPVSRSSAPLC
jgi:hypothetical protein